MSAGFNIPAAGKARPAPLFAFVHHGAGRVKSGQLMRLHDKPQTDVASGFSLIELAVTSTVIIVVVLLLFSCQAQDRRLALRAACRANLSRIGPAFRVMRVEFNDRYPMQVSKRSGGTQEYADTAEVFRHFQVLSNDLQTPKVLVCPADNRNPASTFLSLSNVNLSYFVGLDANRNCADVSLLAGDRNITNGGRVPPGHILLIKTNSLVGWTHDLHSEFGTVVMADEYVHGLDTPSLRVYVGQSCSSNRLAIP